MKKSMMFSLTLALTGILASQVSFAGYPDKADIAEFCRKVASELNQIAASKKPDGCTGDVQVAAAYLSATETKVRHERFNEALVSVHYGESELKEIAYSRAYCAHFSSLIKPYIAKVIRITSELEVLERIKA